MLIKIFLALLAAAIAVMGFFTFYSWSWLGSIGSPASAVSGYEYHSGLSWPFLWLSATILLIIANSVAWTTRKLWPLWTTLIFFQVFVLIRTFWLDRAFSSFKAEAGLADPAITLAPIFAAMLIVIAAAIVFFDQFLVLRLREKTFPEETVSAVEDPPIKTEV